VAGCVRYLRQCLVESVALVGAILFNQFNYSGLRLT
jgi:hypothetical protein